MTDTLRFAPSPTGYLHLGNARTAIANALYAAQAGARLLLRLDDTDAARSRDEYVIGIMQDLAWLGIAHEPPFKQSERFTAYDAAAAALRTSGRLYPCFESEDELRAKREQQARRGRAPIYDRAALTMTAEQRARAQANGKAPYWRFRLSDEAVAWHDAVRGRVTIPLNSVSDPVLIRADGTPLYTFTSVVDDLDTRVTLVIRGEDHVTNTALQIDLFRALGERPPGFAHLPLLFDEEGGKLSKRAQSLTLRGLRADGFEPEALLGLLARLGTRRDPEPGTIASLSQDFSLQDYTGAPRFDAKQLLLLNRRVLRELPFERIREPGVTEALWAAVRGNIDQATELRHWVDVVGGTIGVPEMDEADRAYAGQAAALLPPEPWTDATWNDWTMQVRARSGRKAKQLYQPLRLALTGEQHGPEMAMLLPMIGRARALERLRL